MASLYHCWIRWMEIGLSAPQVRQILVLAFSQIWLQPLPGAQCHVKVLLSNVVMQDAVRLGARSALIYVLHPSGNIPLLKRAHFL